MGNETEPGPALKHRLGQGRAASAIARCSNSANARAHGLGGAKPSPQSSPTLVDATLSTASSRARLKRCTSAKPSELFTAWLASRVTPPGVSTNLSKY